MDHKQVVDGKRVIFENRPFIHYKYYGEAMARSRPGQARPGQIEDSSDEFPRDIARYVWSLSEVTLPQEAWMREARVKLSWHSLTVRHPWTL